MPLKVYNTLSRKKEILKPFANAQAFGSEAQARRGKKLKLFVCGPTVYDAAHIGHARTYIAFDVIVKYLRQNGYDVFYLQNITDIDDKIINRAKENNATPEKLARQFEKEYLNDMKFLKINGVTKYARATDHIEEIISQVERLIKKDCAYKIEDGIYYDISKFKGYGKLSKRTILQAEDAVSRIDESKEKRNKGDFCLWKFSKPGEPNWQSPWGKGRPGWHIEDTAITEKYFGPQYDIHGGARDLIFPHHEAEIAQMEAISGRDPLVKYWLHSGFLTVNGQKMAKSLGNFITIRDFLKENSARFLRFLVVKAHYRSPIDYSEKLIFQTKRELEKIDEFLEKVKSKSKTELPAMEAKVKKRTKFSSPYENKFNTAMEDDFNTPKAVAALFELINKGNALIAQNKLSRNDAKTILDFLKETDDIFGFIFPEKKKEKIPAEVSDLVKEREKYRKEGAWQKSDEIRKKLQKLGYKIEDTKEGPEVKKI